MSMVNTPIRNPSNRSLPTNMAELIIPNEKVRELTEAPRQLPIEIEGSVTFEILLTIWSTLNAKETNTARDLGMKWVEEVRSKMSDELREELISLGGPYGYVWLALSGFLLTAPHPHSPDNVFSWLAEVDDHRLRRWALGYISDSEDQGLIEQAATGDTDALADILGDKTKTAPEKCDFAEWLITTDGLPLRYADVLRDFRKTVFVDYEKEFGDSIGRAAAARKAAPQRGDAKAVVEEVTQGIDFDIPLGISRVMLVPSVVTRPLSLVDGHRGTLVVYYGIADEFIDSDPEAPPSWLVRTYKALSDERRLRIMRRLSEGSASLEELTNLLGLSKSTVHHHISQLRAAGLIRVHIPSDHGYSKQKIYSLREQSLTDAQGFLDSYLRTSDQEQRHA